MPPARKRPKRVVPFVATHELQYGVRAVERDDASGEVTSVLCMFCAAFGREDDPRGSERQRARTQRAKYWGGPNFRTDNYKSHLAVQHPARWAQYQALTLEDKQRFFETVAVPPKKDEASHPRRSLEPAETVTITMPQVQSSMLEPPIEADSAPESVDEDAEAPTSAPMSPAASVSSSVSSSGREDAAVEGFESSAEVIQTTEVEETVIEGGPVEGEEGGDVMTFLLDRNVVKVALGIVLSNEAGSEIDGLFESTIDRRDTQDQLMSDGTAEYRAEVRSVEFFRRVVELTALGLTFDQIATICQSQWGERICRGPRDVARMARVAMGANLQVLARILKKSWAFSLSLHSVDRRRPENPDPRLFIDVRLRACHAGKIVVFHALALPVPTAGDANSAGEELFNTMAKYLQALHTRWLHKVIGCSTEVVDSANSGASSSVNAVILAFTRKLEQQVPTGFVRVASARPSLDALLQRFFDSILLTAEATWQSQLVGLSAYLQRQMSIGNAEEMSAASVAPCPFLSDMSWLKQTESIRWFDNARVPIQRLLARRNASVTPPPSWWIHLKVALVVSSMAMKTRTGLQGGYTTLLSQQPQRISMLRLALAGDVGVEGPLPEYQRAALRDQTGLGDMIGSHDGMFAVKPHSVVAFVRGMSSWSAELFDELSAEERQKIIVNTADRLLDLVQGLQAIAEQLEQQGGSSTATLSAFPPVLPHQVAMLQPTAFQNIIRLQQPRLTETFSNTQLAAIEMEHQDLRSAAAGEAGTQQLLALSAENPAASFDGAWSMLRGRWGLLADFCGGLATVFPSPNSETRSPWLSTSELKRPLVDFSLESRLQCQQFASLQALR